MMVTADELAALPSIRSLGAETGSLPRLRGVGQAALAIGPILQSLAQIGAQVPVIAGTFGQNKALLEQQRLQERALEAQAGIAAEQARSSSETWRTIAPYAGVGLVVVVTGLVAWKLWPGRRRR